MIEDGTVDGLVAIGGGVYILAVVYQGNFWPFFSQLKSEKGYLQFLIACAVLKYVYENDKSGIAGPLIGLGVFAASLSYASKNNFGSVFKDFAAGRKTLFETVTALVP